MTVLTLIATVNTNDNDNDNVNDDDNSINDIDNDNNDNNSINDDDDDRHLGGGPPAQTAMTEPVPHRGVRDAQEPCKDGRVIQFETRIM